MPAKNQRSSVDAAIAAVESSTSLGANSRRKPCDCNGQKHPLLSMAPNCLSCGKIICVRDGFGPCLFCGSALLTDSELEEVLSELKAERSRELMQAHNAGQRKKPPKGTAGKGLDEAQAHRDRLLGYQATSAQRTRVYDEVADFETPDVGASKWASPLERARQIKRQIEQMKQIEWDSKDEWEKRQVVLSLDVSKGKVMKTMQNKERPKREQETNLEADAQENDNKAQHGSGAFSKNPLLGSLIRPVYDAREKASDGETEAKDQLTGSGHNSRAKWRRVQDDLEDNEAVILDGGVYGAN